MHWSSVSPLGAVPLKQTDYQDSSAVNSSPVNSGGLWAPPASMLEHWLAWHQFWTLSGSVVEHFCILHKVLSSICSMTNKYIIYTHTWYEEKNTRILTEALSSVWCRFSITLVAQKTGEGWKGSTMVNCSFCTMMRSGVLKLQNWPNKPESP